MIKQVSNLHQQLVCWPSSVQLEEGLWIRPSSTGLVALVESGVTAVRALITSLPKWADIPASSFGAAAEDALQSECSPHALLVFIVGETPDMIVITTILSLPFQRGPSCWNAAHSGVHLPSLRTAGQPSSCLFMRRT